MCPQSGGEHGAATQDRWKDIGKSPQAHQPVRPLSALAVQASGALPTPLKSWLAPPPLRKLPRLMLPSAATVAASSVICAPTPQRCRILRRYARDMSTLRPDTGRHKM